MTAQAAWVPATDVVAAAERAPARRPALVPVIPRARVEASVGAAIVLIRCAQYGDTEPHGALDAAVAELVALVGRR